MWISAFVAGAAGLLLTSALAVAAQQATPAMTAGPEETQSINGYEFAKREKNRVLLRTGYVCADPSTALLAPADIEQVVRRLPGPETPGLVPAERTYTVPMASYPTEQMSAGNPGAALVMINIREDGSVEDAKVACATGGSFAQRARETTLRNRYRAARLNDVPVASVAFQIVTFAIAED